MTLRLTVTPGARVATALQPVCDVIVPVTAAPAGGTTARAASRTSLEVDFVERGLVPHQNYAYTGSAGTATVTFQCYRSSTFTPLRRVFAVTATTTSPDVRGYSANANGVVRGFIFVDPVLPPFAG